MNQKKDYPLPFLERGPTEAAPDGAPVLILLHGRAAKAETIFSIEGLLDPTFHVIAIQAPYTSEKGDFEWFLPYDYDHPLESFSEKQFAESEQILTAQIQEMISERQIDQQNLFIGGFSQGAAMSHIVSLRGVLSPRGIVALSGFFPRPLEKWKLPASLPSYFISHGTKDNILPVSESLYAVDFYKRHAAQVEFIEYNGRHKMTIPLINSVNQWVKDQY